MIQVEYTCWDSTCQRWNIFVLVMPLAVYEAEPYYPPGSKLKRSPIKDFALEHSVPPHADAIIIPVRGDVRCPSST